MELHGCFAPGFPSSAVQITRSKVCARIHHIPAVSPSKTTSESPKSVGNQALTQNPRVCNRIHTKHTLTRSPLRNPRAPEHICGKHTAIVTNGYGNSGENAGREVESPDEDKTISSSTATVDEEEKKNSVEEIGQALKEIRMEKSATDSGFWTSVLEETGRIEWPPFQKVLGTTSLVLAVIVGSSAVLLTVNAILAELSDKIFAGIGVQDILAGVSK